MKTCSLISYAPRRVRVAAVSRYRANDRFFICRPSRAVKSTSSLSVRPSNCASRVWGLETQKGLISPNRRTLDNPGHSEHHSN
jgi:hypothetical protein